jgi:hypothetical protein
MPSWISTLWTAIKGIALAVGLFFVRKSGSDAEKKEALENELKAIDRANKARDKLARDTDTRRRLRDDFGG